MSYYKNDDTNDEGVRRMSANTQRYRQKILQLATRSNTSIAWETSQHMLDKMWEHQQHQQKQEDANNSYETALAPPISSGAIIHSDITTTAVGACVYSCPHCGVVVHPGHRGTTLRVQRLRKLKRKPIMIRLPDNTTSTSTAAASRKTLRRRQQRQIQKLAEHQQRQQQWKVKSGGSSTSSKKLAYNSTDASAGDAFKLEKEKLMVLLQDDHIDICQQKTNSSFLVLTCGRCRGKVCLEGVKLQQQQSTPGKKGGKSLFTAGAAAAIAKKRQSQQPQSQEASAFIALDSQLAMELDFQPLPSATDNNQKRTRHAVGDLQNTRSAAGNTSLIEQRLEQTRKKKKKTPKDGQKPNKLMNFLSSLNDH